MAIPHATSATGLARDLSPTFLDVVAVLAPTLVATVSVALPVTRLPKPVLPVRSTGSGAGPWLLCRLRKAALDLVMAADLVPDLKASVNVASLTAEAAKAPPLGERLDRKVLALPDVSSSPSGLSRPPRRTSNGAAT